MTHTIPELEAEEAAAQSWVDQMAAEYAAAQRREREATTGGADAAARTAIALANYDRALMGLEDVRAMRKGAA